MSEIENPFEEDAVFPKQEENTLSIIVKSATKEKIEEIANNIIQDIKENDEDYLKAYIQAKAIKEISEKIIEGIKVDAMEEADLFEKDQKFNGCTVTVKNLGDSYIYEDDEEWAKLTEEENKIKVRKKEIEKLMVQASKVSQLVTADGEVVTPARIEKYGGKSLTVTLPKK